MRSSPSPQALATAQAKEKEVCVDVSPFLYSEIPPGVAHAFMQAETLGNAPGDGGPDAVAREIQARELGRQEGEAAARRNFEEQITRERAAIGAALAQFADERAAYYTRLESEVVRLALSIAGKVLHREAQVDPFLLAGIVRVALEKIEGATGVQLLVNPQLVPEWRRYMALHMDPASVPEIVEDAALEPERCVLRTSMGTAEMGLEVQLKEIERGLMDLLAARPGAAR